MSDVHGHTMQVSRLLHLLYILSLIYPYNPMESGGAFADVRTLGDQYIIQTASIFGWRIAKSGKTAR